MRQTDQRRILLIDDTPAIHEEFEKILARQRSRPDLERLESELRQLACALSTKWAASREAELKVAQLEKLIRARDCQLENLNLDLLRARDAARAGSRVKREFLANMGHEIRTPMNAILAMTQLALQGELSAPQRQYLETARGAAESLMATINGILDLSVLESGRLELELTEFSLEEVLGRLARVMEEKAELKQIRLAIDAAPQALVPLVGDPYRLGQVLINLCDNAVKFSELGEVLVRVRVERQEGERLTLRFAVRDSGAGISADQLAQLFQPFSQLDASSTRRKGGAGMGLAIARELVELMAGELAVASQPGRGSEFSFCAAFPRAGRVAPSPPEPGRQQPASAPAAAREVDPEEVRELLDRMIALFDQDLSQALAVKELLQRKLEGSVLAPEFGRMARQVEQFDFDGILRSRQRLDSMLENLRERGLQAPLFG